MLTGLGDALALSDVGIVITVKPTVLFDATLLVEPPVAEMAVIVTVVAPRVASEPPGIVNVPFVAPIVSTAVLPADALAPVRL